ncbi:MAG: amidophosphoribosyltransferase, partial [Oscillospiraceae bacterium]|nr:amidophosphoribosyltransferase [Oscillospiraceae bacterium]
IGVPDSGLDAALGYARESGVDFDIGFIRNRYVTRSFIQPTQFQRDDAVKIKLNTIKPVVDGKRVVMIDDSIVRGTTCKQIVSLLREAGAKEVHLRIASPPFAHMCYFGVDIDREENLIAHRMNKDEITEFTGVDSLEYLSLESVHKIANGASCEFCDGCFSGNYPIDTPEKAPQDKFRQKINPQIKIYNGTM